MTTWDMVVVGMDGCREGWIAVVWRDERVDVHWWSSIDVLGREVPDAEAVAIDIPLGLSQSGDRRADQLARQRLRGRASTVFNAPPRACLESGEYDGANELSRRHGAKGLSRQSFGLLPKIREVDAYWRSAPCSLYEVHPELSFARLNGDVALASKKSWEGVLSRRDALAGVGISLDGFRGAPARRAAPDDVLDAGVCAWTARQIILDQVQCLPDPPEVDATGREMCIRV